MGYIRPVCCYQLSCFMHIHMSLYLLSRWHGLQCTVKGKFLLNKFALCLISKSHMLKLYNALANSWFKLLRVKSCKNDLKRNKNYFKLAGSSSYLFYFFKFIVNFPLGLFRDKYYNSTSNKKKKILKRFKLPRVKLQ